MKFKFIILSCFIFTSAAVAYLYYSQPRANNTPATSTQASSYYLDKFKPLLDLPVKNYGVNKLGIVAQIDVNTLPMTDTIKQMDKTSLKQNSATYENWLGCLTQDAAGNPINETERTYRKLEKNLPELIDADLPYDTDLFVSTYLCGYSDGLYFLRVVKGDKILREFTYLFGGLRLNNASPDKRKIVLTGIKSPERGHYERETFIYDFSKDTVTFLPNISCVDDRYYWIDNDHVASINLSTGEGLYYAMPTDICIWKTDGNLLKVYSTSIPYYIAYPGGALFAHNIKMLSDNTILFYGQFEINSQSVCAILIEEGDEFRYQASTPVRGPFRDQITCGEPSNFFYDRDKQYLQLDILFDLNSLGSILKQ